MKLLLVRHGQTDWNLKGKIQGSKDIALNSNGVIQAEQLSGKIIESNYTVSKIYSSQQIRATKTAKILSESIKTKFIVTKGLEEIYLGEWEGLSWDEVQSLYPSEFNDWFNNRRHTRPPNGESYQDLLERALTSIRGIIDKKEENIVIVTHSAVIMCLQCYITNTPFEEMTKFKTDNTSITEIDSNLVSL